MNINTVSIEQHREDYIRPNADLETGPQMRSKAKLNSMYSECLDGIGEFNDFEYYVELDPKFKLRVQTIHKVA